MEFPSLSHHLRFSRTDYQEHLLSSSQIWVMLGRAISYSSIQPWISLLDWIPIFRDPEPLWTVILIGGDTCVGVALCSTSKFEIQIDTQNTSLNYTVRRKLQINIPAITELVAPFVSMVFRSVPIACVAYIVLVASSKN